jgi:uncharacterized membrane protein (UPF0136 family)
LPDHEAKSATEPSMSTVDKRQDSAYLVLLAIATHAGLIVVATVTLVVGLSTIPISYCVLAMHASSCYMYNASWACMSCFNRSKREDFVTIDGVLSVILSFLVKVCAFALLLTSPPISHSKTHSGEDSGKDDALMQGMISLLPAESPQMAKFYIGLIASCIAGFTFSLAFSVAKRPQIKDESHGMTQSYKNMISLVLSLGITVILAYSFVPASLVSSGLKTDALFAEFFWITVFSLTAKAALSISYDD